MRGGEVRKKIRRLRTGLAALAAVYRRDRRLLHLAGTAWFVTTRTGLIGLRQWLLDASLAADLVPTRAVSPRSNVTISTPDYQAWLHHYDHARESEIQAARQHLATLDLPEILIVAAINKADLPSVGGMIASWQAQIHSKWRAAIVASPDLSAKDLELLSAKVVDYAQISVTTTEDAVAAALGSADFTLLCFGCPQLSGLALYMFLEAAIRTDSAIVYSDHDQLQDNGLRTNPVFKPQFSPEYLKRINYIGDCVLLSPAVRVVASDLLGQTSLALAEFDRLVCRLVLSPPSRNRRVEHLPFVLFHVSVARDRPILSDTAAPDVGPSVSLIIPTRDGLGHLQACIASILEKTTYDLDRVEIIIVDNQSGKAEMLAYLDQLAHCQNFSVLHYPHPFNFAAINNFGAGAATGDIIVFLNDDTAVHYPAWLSKLVAYTCQPGVGIVGAKLMFPDGTIQHGGCVAGAGMGTVQHLLNFVRADEVNKTDHTRELSLVTGACLAMRHDVFRNVGGFDPVLRVTWNDVKLCLVCLEAGFRNIYIADPLLVHDESRTRGSDNNVARNARYFREADYTRRQFRSYFYDDPSYSPNLSVEKVLELAAPPRVRKPWFRQLVRPTRVLLLSVVYKVGYGVPLVIEQQARKLVNCGFEVFVGGPQAENEVAFIGCQRVFLDSPKSAAIFAFANEIALVICHTPPFFEVPLLIGGHIPVLAYDYGEPSAEFFPDPTRSYLINVSYQKRAAAALTTTVATISQSVKDESFNRDALVLSLANSHLAKWSNNFWPQRDRVRQTRGWQDAFVVFTVSRFHENERAYKGLDKVATIMQEFPYLYPDQSTELIWVLAGAGTPADVAQAESLGFVVFPNISDEIMADLYKAADVYMSFSKWEGYNLGIGQALAMGLPTLGSDIPAHREFGITTSNSVLVACAWLAEEIGRQAASAAELRLPIVHDWEASTTAFVAVVHDVLRDSALQKSRSGASGCIWLDRANDGAASSLS